MVDLIWHLKVPFHFKEPSEIQKNMIKKEVHLRTPLRVYLKAHLRMYFEIFIKMHKKVHLRLKLRVHLN